MVTRKAKSSIALIAGACIAIAIPGTAAAAPTVRLWATLGGAAVVPDVGDRNGDGKLSLAVEPNRRRACFELKRSRLGELTAAQIRESAKGRAGPTRLTLLERRRRPFTAQTVKRCTSSNRTLLWRIAHNPTGFYVSVETRAFPDGALRGQLGRALGGFERGNLTDFDAWSVSHGSLAVTGELAYDGARAARASNEAVGNQYQRVWYDVHWPSGADVWYGMALYIPRLSDWCWWSPIRWDNFTSHGSAADVGGLVIEDGSLSLVAGTYDAQDTLIGARRVPEARWFWVEVHQRFSGHEGRALSELYIDGARVGNSTAANSTGRPIDQIRYGNVAMASQCSVSSEIYFDRVSFSAGPRGPR